ncbi:unnamed protein product [Effrenium voratum]|nr:unnamed protein product [Effrenium voratum]
MSRLYKQAGQAECDRRDARRERFTAQAGPAKTPTAEPGEPSWGPVVGTSTALFRPFLRLREAPDPATVRPEKVLAASLSALLDESTQPSGGWGAAGGLKVWGAVIGGHALKAPAGSARIS